MQLLKDLTANVIEPISLDVPECCFILLNVIYVKNMLLAVKITFLYFTVCMQKNKKKKGLNVCTVYFLVRIKLRIV